MFIIDSHCHLDRLDYETVHQDLSAVLAAARQREVLFFLSVATTLSEFPALEKLTAANNQIRLSCGVHPLSVDEDQWSPELLRQYADSSRVIALGETGLDYFYQQDNKKSQQAAFCEHIRVAHLLQKPVIVHTREAREDTLAILASEHVEKCGGVLHCFTEDKETARRLLDLGMYISFSGIVTFRNAEQIREAARYVPLDRILVETDSPYLAPVPYRGKPNQPAYTRDVAEYMAGIKGVTTEQLAYQTTQNFAHLFRLDLNEIGFPSVK